MYVYFDFASFFFVVEVLMKIEVSIDVRHFIF